MHLLKMRSNIQAFTRISISQLIFKEGYHIEKTKLEMGVNPNQMHLKQLHKSRGG